MSTAQGVASDVVRPYTAGSAMSSSPGQYLIQRVVRKAVDVFRAPDPAQQAFRDGLASLTQLMTQLTAQDVGFDPRWVRDTRPYHPGLGVVPMTYVRLYENSYVSIGIFILKNGFTLPTHDHPNMYGVLKVLHGTLHMQSFTPVQKPGILNGVRSGDGVSGWETRQTPLGTVYHTVKEVPRRMGPTDPPCLLTPEKANIHQIKAVDGPVAFLDILAPPYDNDDHVYHNFRELEPEKLRQLTGGELGGGGWLVRVRNIPLSYGEGSTAQYRGPPLDDVR